MTKAARAGAALVLLLWLGGCNTAERLAQVGRVPELAPIENPTARPGYRPVSLPMPDPDPEISAGANSLWREGARGFFRDQRARRVGDVLTVNVTIKDSANVQNETARSRKNNEDVSFADFFGLQNKLNDWLPSPVDPSDLVNLDSSTDNLGRGAVKRSEDIEMNVAALVTQILPNGNMVIEGRQEVRINFEVREVLVAGIARPEDITPQNTIPHFKIAELRVAYGGRGQITDVQQPRYGAQILDILLPY
jgi:flagellar L-ring protein precursor FlgH